MQLIKSQYHTSVKAVSIIRYECCGTDMFTYLCH
jgi:hypothetical protein